MITPFAHLNSATIRAEARARWLRRIADLAVLAALIALALILARSLLITTLAFDQLLIDAAARGAM